MRKLLFSLCLILGLMGYSCGPESFNYTYTKVPHNSTIRPKRIIPIYVDKQFSVEDKLSIERAISQWNYALNGQMLLVVADYNFDMQVNLIIKAQEDKGWLFLKVDSYNSTIPDQYPHEQCKRTPGCMMTLAWVDDIGGSVMKMVRDRMQTKDVEYITLHEISHLLGNEHNDDRTSLMFPRYSKFSYYCVDQYSAYGTAKYYGLNPELLNYCHNKH